MQRLQAKPLALALVLLSSLAAQAAPVAPDAGQTSRELQKQPELNAPKATEPLHIKGDTAPKGAADNNVRFAVKAIHVTGSSIYTAGRVGSHGRRPDRQ